MISKTLKGWVKFRDCFGTNRKRGKSRKAATNKGTPKGMNPKGSEKFILMSLKVDVKKLKEERNCF